MGMEMEKVPGQLECQLKITDDNLLTNQVYYQNAKSVDPDSLSSVSFTDTLLLFAGTYCLTSTVIEKNKDILVPDDNGVNAASVLKTNTLILNRSTRMNQ